jgi:molybdopterin-guanine dinucleotide biosynthesis protein A
MISAALMAGGKSTRMGRDKCLIQINGIPMWQRQLDLLLAVSPEVFVTAPDRPYWLPENVRWIPDAVLDKGPIGGLAAALAQALNNQVLILAADMPAMSSAFLKKLAGMAAQDSGIVPQIGEGYEPLCAIYPREALPVVRDQLLVKRDYSLQTLIRLLIQRGLMQNFYVSDSEAGLFRNLNFPSDI